MLHSLFDNMFNTKNRYSDPQGRRRSKVPFLNGSLVIDQFLWIVDFGTLKNTFPIETKSKCLRFLDQFWSNLYVTCPDMI